MNTKHHGSHNQPACPAVAAYELFNRTFVAARPGGYGGGDQRMKARGNGGKSCIVRKVIEAKKWPFVARAMKNPVYGYRAWQHFCAIPVAA